MGGDWIGPKLNATGTPSCSGTSIVLAAKQVGTMVTRSLKSGPSGDSNARDEELHDLN
jgi:hypothetical protein